MYEWMYASLLYLENKSEFIKRNFSLTDLLMNAVYISAEDIMLIHCMLQTNRTNKQIKLKYTSMFLSRPLFKGKKLNKFTFGFTEDHAPLLHGRPKRLDLKQNKRRIKMILNTVMVSFLIISLFSIKKNNALWGNNDPHFRSSFCPACLQTCLEKSMVQ